MSDYSKTQFDLTYSYVFVADYDTTDDEDEPEEFQIVVVRAKDDAPLEANWSMLIESDSINYGMKFFKRIDNTFLFFSGS
jgi:hypothetical protein